MKYYAQINNLDSLSKKGSSLTKDVNLSFSKEYNYTDKKSIKSTNGIKGMLSCYPRQSSNHTRKLFGINFA